MIPMVKSAADQLKPLPTAPRPPISNDRARWGSRLSLNPPTPAWVTASSVVVGVSNPVLTVTYGTNERARSRLTPPPPLKEAIVRSPELSPSVRSWSVTLKLTAS